MTSFLLIISFLLHIITLSAIYFLLKQIQVLRAEQNSDIPELLEAYLEEIKAENNRLQDEVSANSTPIQKKPKPFNLSSENNKGGEIEDKSITHSEYSPIKTETLNDEVEASTEARILQLHQKGYSEEEIARRLNCGKTEVALTVKLHRKK